MRSHLMLAVISSLLYVGNSLADGIPIEPGQWEMTTTMKMSMMPQPQITMDVECLEEDVFNPETFSKDEESACGIINVTTDGNTARWEIDCPVENGTKMTGSWEMTSHGDTLNGNGTMTTEVAGQKVGFDMTWEGKRMGDCE